MLFKKILVANRGEIAVRALRTCRELRIKVVTLYEKPDVRSLHVRLADESVRLETPAGFSNREAILNIAKEKKADAIYPGYGFLAEDPEFIRACESAGVAFIGPPSAVVSAVRSKTDVLQRARQAGFPTIEHSQGRLDGEDLASVQREAERLGYPIIVKSCVGGRGPGGKLASSPEHLEKTLRQALAEARAVYGDQHVYLERAMLAAHQVSVQVLGDRQGRRIHLGESQALAQHGNRKLISETPAPALSSWQRGDICQAALELAEMFNLENACTVEFLVDESGRFYFTEIKPRIQVDHPLVEMVTRVDLVQEQIRIASGEPLSLGQAEIPLHGSAILCRINAEDPRKAYLPSPGRIQRARMPGGPFVRVDGYVNSGCEIPAEYDPLMVKLTAWGEDRGACLGRMRRALEEIKLIGTSTNLPLLQSILQTPEFQQGNYSTQFQARPPLGPTITSSTREIWP